VPDAIVVGSGPNGLAAAVTLARAGLDVTVYEGSDRIGGGAATAELIEPGVRHDVCSAVHPLALASEFFRRFELARRVELLTPAVSYAHALSPVDAVLAHRDLEATVEGLRTDGQIWRRLFAPLVRDRARALGDVVGEPLLGMPRHPLTLARFGVRALLLGSRGSHLGFSGERAPALLAGVVAHAIGRMPSLGPSSAGLLLAALGHAGGWPLVRGGSGEIVRVLADDLILHGGRIETGVWIRDLRDLPRASATLLDVTPRAFLRMTGGRRGDAALRTHGELRRAAPYRRFRYGDAAAKVDFVLSEPAPWRAADLHGTVTVHLGGRREEVARAEAEVAAGRHPRSPYVLTVQPTALDRGRAPGRHVLWAYTHVPAGSDRDPTDAIVDRIEEFAPGFRDTIVASVSTSARDLEAHNPNYIGGDIASGAASARQLIARPVSGTNPWQTPVPGVYLCSASTAPGPGVHGLAGWHAARRALRAEFGITVDPDLSIGSGTSTDPGPSTDAGHSTGAG
jgi:phytoene dehydrogenase-like protein